ncbi:MAG: hypothetical protein HRU07_04920 [Nitrosopumilus sp.]|jgi:hypothetical protein|nr:hypothetical protein [Nitrosopumilus sp.]NRA05495.1 hypothetical protein [Nitrosopumilus sp.]
MVKQISLDAWQIQQLTDLLKKGSNIVTKTNRPIVLYRQTLEEEDESYEEIVCTLTKGYVIEQMVTSGGILVPSFQQQFVFTIEEYPQELLRKSKDRFLEMIDFLEEQIKIAS